MGIENRPYVGTWRLNAQEVYRHTPDAMVYFNGDTAIPGCPTCGGRIDLQPYITSVSVDPSVNPIATASISMQIPKHFGDTIFRDNNLLLRTGLEVHIYMRGYFPVKGMYAGVTPQESGGVNIQNAVMNPYYLVFHGVVTSVSADYSGGEHTVSMSCADLLHFWQYQRMSTNASLFGARPNNSKVRLSLVGHNFDSMSPFGIIYTLFRDTMGAAGGVEFALGNETTAAANSSALGESLFSLSLLYWQKRFSQSLTKLRIFGADGTLYNEFQQAYLASQTSRELGDLPAQNLSDRTSAQAPSFEPFLHNIAASIPQDSLLDAAVSEDDAAEGGTGVNVAELQAFATDISNWGQVNLFESSYETKLELANAVTEVTGYEFYQDVTGDIVFKPPFYNLDTSSSRVYVIKPIDIIQFSIEEKEPEATVMKVTGSWFQNIKGTGVEGEWGTRAEYIDYKMVAKYGWRQQTFETSYYTDPRAMYFAAINRLDLHNVDVESASCTIPTRPELRPGYPVYIEHLDCFYYLQGMSHAVNFGGQSTTTLQLVGKRAKFYAPGKAPEDGTRPSIGDIDLSNTFLPALPLQVKANDESYKLQGFPNVVMALDPELLNPLFSIAGINLNDLTTETGLRTLIRSAIMSNLPVIQIGDEASADEKTRLLNEGPYKIQVGDAEWVDFGFQDLLQQVRDVRAAAVALDDPKADQEQLAKNRAQALDNAKGIIAVVTAVQSQMSKSIPEGDSSAAYLELLNDYKSKFNPGQDTPGYYRYYSASHPNPEQQGQKQLERDPTTGQLRTGALTDASEGGDITVFGFSDGLSEGAAMNPKVPVRAGLPIMRPGTKEAIPTPTHQIRALSFARHDVTVTTTKHVATGRVSFSFCQSTLSKAIKVKYAQALGSTAALDRSVEDVFKSSFDSDLFVIQGLIPSEWVSQVAAPTFVGILGDRATAKFEATKTVDGKEVAVIAGSTLSEKVNTVAALLGDGLAQYTAEVFVVWQQSVAAQYGPEGGANLTDDPVAKASAYSEVHATLSEVNQRVVPDQGVLGGLTSQSVQRAVTSVGPAPYYSPVFPVSDERGYQVVGNHRYGRGLSIEPGGSLERLNATTTSQIANLSLDTVDELVATFDAEGDVSKALGTISIEGRAEIASALDITTEDLLSADGPSIFQRQFAAYFASSRQSTQKTTVTNTAYNLERLGQHVMSQDVCPCKGAEADLKLLAWAEGADPKFLQVEQPDELTEWASSQMVAASVPWAASQQGLRGAALDLKSPSIVGTTAGSVIASGSNLGDVLTAPAQRAGEQITAAARRAAAIEFLPEDEEG